MGFWSWLWDLISGGGSKDADTLQQKDDRLEVLKSKLRIAEDKLRLKQANEKSEEDKEVREEVEKLKAIIGGESLKDEEKDLKDVIHEDEEIQGELRKDEGLSSKAERLGEVIEGIDRKEESNEAQIGSMTGGQSQALGEEQQDIRTQKNLASSERRRIALDKKLSEAYRLKQKWEKILLNTDKKIEASGDPKDNAWREKVLGYIRNQEEIILQGEREK